MTSDCCDVEGMLYKWTNYWGGWQPRWFALNHNVLAYYNSLEEMDKGCKASVNVSAGEVKVHPTDLTRFDIVLQHDQHWYLRASTAAERQKWLIAIGSVKAGTAESLTKHEKESVEAKGELQSRVSELRLYCDLLISQVVKVKEEAQNDPPDPKKLTDASTMLSATCDTFLGTLGQCLMLAENTYFLPSAIERISPHHPKDQQMALPYSSIHKNRHRKRRSLRSVSVDDSGTYSTSLRNSTGKKESRSSAPSQSRHSAPGTPTAENERSIFNRDTTESLAQLTLTSETIPDVSQSDAQNSQQNEPNVAQRPEEHNSSKDTNSNHTKSPALIEVSQEDQLTFFSAMLHSFTDIVLEEDGGIPTAPFLEACDNLLPFLDTIGSTAFAPVKMDLNGNIKKVRTKLETDPRHFSTLQSIVQQEIATNTTKVRNSATDALLWLKRGLRFMQKFLINMKNGEQNLPFALNQAYSDTLKQYHGWVVKGIFALAVKAAPYHDDFIRALGTDSFGADAEGFYSVLMRDVDQYVTAIEVVLNIVDNFYQKHGLDSDVMV